MGIALISLRAGDMPHTIENISTNATTLLQTSFQLEVYTQSYGPPKSWESQLWEFQDSHLGIPEQNDIWVLVSWLSTEYIIRGEGGGFPQVQAVVSLVNLCLPVVSMCTKMFQLCINQLVVWFVQVCVSNWIACQYS